MFKYKTAFSGFSVDDIAKAKYFYSEILGLQVLQGMQGLISLKLAYGTKIIIYTKPNHKPASFTILNFTVENIELAVNELKKAGVVFEKYDWPELKTDDNGISHGTPKIAWFKDPAGNILSVIEQS